MRRCNIVFVSMCLVLAVAGCGQRRAEVSGRVTFKGKDLTHGQVSFVGADGQTVTADIQPDGTYKATGILFGDNQVLVVQMDPNAKSPSELRKEIEEKRRAGNVLLAAKSSLPETEPQAVTITQRSSTFDIALVEKK